MPKKSYVASKVNVHENIFSIDLEEIISIHIPRVIKESPIKKSKSFSWSFTDVRMIKDEYDEDYLVGNLTKSKKSSIKSKVGNETMNIEHPYEVAQTSNFFYHPRTEILVHEVNSHFSEYEFIGYFSELLSKDPVIGEVKIIPLPEPYEIRNELKSIENVTSIRFKLIHPNPGKKEFNLFQEIINTTSAKELDITITNPEGLKPNEDIIDQNQVLTSIPIDPIESGIQLCEKGYGNANIKGHEYYYVQGKRKKLKRKKIKKFDSNRSFRKITVNDFGEERLLSRIRSFILDIIS